MQKIIHAIVSSLHVGNMGYSNVEVDVINGIVNFDYEEKSYKIILEEITE